MRCLISFRFLEKVIAKQLKAEQIKMFEILLNVNDTIE